MEFRLVNDCEDEQVKKLWSYCFERPDEPFFQWFFSGVYKPANTLAAFDQGRMTACLHLLPHRLFLRGVVLPVSYIVGVGVCPEDRGKGLSGRLLQAALAEMRSRGHQASILMPSKAGFYYPFQWNICYNQLKYSLPAEELRTMAWQWGRFAQVSGPAGLEQLNSVYKRFVAGRHGYIVRDQSDWRNIVGEHSGENGYIQLLESDGEAQGYIMYSIAGRKLLVKEMAYTGPRAKAAIYHFLYGHRSQVQSVEWTAPADDTDYLYLPDPQREIRILPFVLGRVVDVAGLLESIQYPADVEAKITIRVRDNLAAWNNRTIQLEVTAGQAAVCRGEGHQADIDCQAGDFSQLVFGRLSIRQLLDSGKAATARADAINTLARLFPRCNNYINDFF